MQRRCLALAVCIIAASCAVAEAAKCDGVNTAMCCADPTGNAAYYNPECTCTCPNGASFEVKAGGTKSEDDDDDTTECTGVNDSMCCDDESGNAAFYNPLCLCACKGTGASYHSKGDGKAKGDSKDDKNVTKKDDKDNECTGTSASSCCSDPTGNAAFWNPMCTCVCAGTGASYQVQGDATLGIPKNLPMTLGFVGGEKSDSKDCTSACNGDVCDKCTSNCSCKDSCKACTSNCQGCAKMDACTSNCQKGESCKGCTSNCKCEKMDGCTSNCQGDGSCKACTSNCPSCKK